MVRTLVLVAVLAGVAVPAGGCASHKDKNEQAKGKALKIPKDRTVLTGFKPAPATRAPVAYFPATALAPAPVPALTPTPTPALTPQALPTSGSGQTVAAAPQFHPVDPTDYAAPRPVYVSSAPVSSGVPVQRAPVMAPKARPAAWVKSGGQVANVPSAKPQAAGRYQVKKGDTLFGIARTRYGNGNRWQQIASANPGLTPETLQAGATIVVP